MLIEQNKQKPCWFLLWWDKRFSFLWEKKGFQWRYNSYIITGIHGRILARIIHIWTLLFNKHGTQFHFSSTHMGENSQYVCALRCSCNSFFHLLDSIKDTKVWENQVWPKWSSEGSKNALREPQFTWLHLAFLPLTPSPPLEWVLHCCHSLAGLLLL